MFPQPLSWLQRAEALKSGLHAACDLIDSQAPHESFEWLRNIEKQFEPGIKCTRDNLRHANRYTCPRTNETGRRGQPLPRNVIGYMSTDK